MRHDRTERIDAISASGLRKSYGDLVVLDGIDLSVSPGTVFALLGPNGAGKTTTVHILSTLIPADGGEGCWLPDMTSRATPCGQSRDRSTGQFSAIDGQFTGEENLRLIADLRHLGRIESRRRVDELLERFDLTEAAKKPASTYSGGMQRRLDLAMTLIGSPQIIFLDEPTAGLDPRSRQVMWDIIRELVADGVTVFLRPSTSRRPIGSPIASPCWTTGRWGGGEPGRAEAARPRWPNPSGVRRHVSPGSGRPSLRGRITRRRDVESRDPQ